LDGFRRTLEFDSGKAGAANRAQLKFQEVTQLPL